MRTAATEGYDIDYSKYANDSYAIETREEREAFNRQFTEIYGKEAMTGEGTTKGSSRDTKNAKEHELNYTSTDVGFDTSSGDEAQAEQTEEITRKVSTLVTKDNEGYVLDLYQMPARVSEAGLILPYEDRIHLEDLKQDIPLNGVDTGSEGVYTYYKPITEYFNHINLGLVKRDETDLTVSQDLYKAALTVNQDEVTYKYSTLYDLEKEEYADKLNMLLDIQAVKTKYQIGLYNSDFYYRSSVYKANGTTEITKAIQNAKKNSELRLFATYRMSVYNDSIAQNVSVNELINYFDSTYTLVSSDVSTQIENEEGIRSEKVIAESPYYRIYSQYGSTEESTDSENPTYVYNYNRAEDTSKEVTGLNRGKVSADSDEYLEMDAGSVEWTVEEGYSESVDSGTYKRMKTATFSSIKDGDADSTSVKNLRPGEKLEIFVTFEVDKAGYESIAEASNKEGSESYAENQGDKDGERAKLLGEKNSIVEISNYTTFYTEDSVGKNNNVAYIAGQISGRVDKDSAPDNINIHDLDKTNFEDDTESAPVFKIYLRDKKEGQRTLNGTVWEDRLTDEVKNTVDSDKSSNTLVGNGKLEDGEQGIAGATVSLVEKIKIKDSDKDEYTEYEYVWPDEAFGDAIKGYTSVKMSDKEGKYEFTDFVSGNYVVRYEYGNTLLTLKYNGQDYKNTAYQEGIQNPSASEIVEEDKLTNDQSNESFHEQLTLNNEWHDLTGLTKNIETDISDARDYEARRLEVIANSKTINNSLAEVLALADTDEYKALYDALYKRMYEGDEDKTYQTVKDNVLGMTDAEIAADENLKIFGTQAKLKEFVDKTNVLIGFTAMEANTAKLNVEIEYAGDLNYGKTKKSTDGTFYVNVGGSATEIEQTLAQDAEDSQNVKYEILNVDFGLERRPDTIIQLDKYLTNINLKKQGEDILNADINDDGEIMNTDTALNRERLLYLTESEGVQGFKYIQMEADYAKDVKVKLSYKVKVTNKSNVDYASETLVSKTYNSTPIFAENGYRDSANADLKTGENIAYGKYLGLYYYTHDLDAVNGEASVSGTQYKDLSVKTTVDKLVDYVDTTTSLASNNLEEDAAWDNNSGNQETIQDGVKPNYLAGLISDDSYTVRQQAEKTLYNLEDDLHNIYLSSTMNSIALSNNTNLTATGKTIEAINLERGPKGEGQLTYETGEDTAVGHKKLADKDNGTVKIENVYGYNDERTSQGKEYYVDTFNKDLTQKLTSININDSEAVTSSTINIVTEMGIKDDTSMDDLIYDGLAEVLIYSNSVGRRTMAAIPGNAFEIVKQESEAGNTDPEKYGGFWNAGHSSNTAKDSDILRDISAATPQEQQRTMQYALNTKDVLAKAEHGEGIFIAELDTDSVDYVTFTVPTGLNYNADIANQIIIITLIVLIISALAITGGTVYIVQKKNNLIK